jgi:predicted regulator of amino acid metabolism with ACT domain
MNKTGAVVAMSAGLLALTALGGTAFAQWSPGNAEVAYEKIAEELGQDQRMVAEAFATASDEARDAMISVKLAKWIEIERITQTEADEIQAWYDASPDAIDNIRRTRPQANIDRVAELLGVDVETLQAAAGDARNAMAIAAYSGRLDAAVADGRITEDDSVIMLEQFENRPQPGMGQRGGQQSHKPAYGKHHGPQNGLRGLGGGIRDFAGMRDTVLEAGDAPLVVDPSALTL